MWQALGVERCREYCVHLVRSAAAMLTVAWGGGAPALAPPEMHSHMALVGLPLAVAAACAKADKDTASGGGGAAGSSGAGGGSRATGGSGASPDAASATSADAKLVQDQLHHGFRIECPVKCIAGYLYVRISAQVYNEMADYERLRDAVLALPGVFL
uniref:Uncharacterized protein n=1 Tax=Chlamydomonas euryale TaxID=1486919 RepID=A0A7R9V8T9_9CHLO|mmetsp:Transcript_22691/g.67562  ORF Transcript_22691/g.67562 Transcript_22691/m.67562 type:complete len:157 (+) Transcript_22691:284-754(+)